MRKPRLTIISMLAAILFGGFCVSVHAQAATGSGGETSYEATLYLLVSSSANVPSAAQSKQLEGVSRKIREQFRLENLSLASTHFARLGHDGSLDHKGLALVGSTSGSSAPTILEWHMSRVKSAAGNELRMASFRLGARVPVRTTAGTAGMGPIVNYENLGITLAGLTLSDGEPTLLGTLALPGSGSVVFVVIAMRPV